MKRVLLCLMFVAAICVACDNDNNETKSQFEVTFTEMECQAGESSATITTTRPIAQLDGTDYIISDSDLYIAYRSAEGSNETWATEFVTDGEKLCFTLTGLEAETEYSAELWYNGGMRGMFHSDTITFTTLAATPDPDPDPTPDPEPDPEPDPDTIELPYLSGIYFSNQYGATENDYNYSIVLATAERCLDIITGEILILDNSQYLFLDLYAQSPAEEYNIRFDVPVGTYTLDTKNLGRAGSIAAELSSFYTTDDTTGNEVFFEAGTVTVTDEAIYAALRGKDGNDYHFSCPTRSVDNSQNFGPTFSPPEQSTLEGDLDIAFRNCAIFTECYGDYYVVGKSNWLLYVKDEDTGDTISFELLADLDATLPTGHFPVTNDLNERQMALPGYVNGGETMWSWYYHYADYTSVTASSPIASGVVAVTENSDGTLTVSVDVVDDMGNRIAGECRSENISLNSRAEACKRKPLTLR